MKLSVSSNSKLPVEVFMQLSVRKKPGVKKFGIGFELYQLKGNKVEGRRNPTPVETNNGGYKVTESVFFDGSLESTSDPLTLFISTFEENIEAEFRFTVHYKHEQGTVTL